jgi:hypothetical protein
VSEKQEVSAAGWDAIDEALRPIYGEREPLHWGTVIRWSLGGRDPLDGISAYKREGDQPHWHIISYGLSELYDKESPNAETSGFGFELTFRLGCGPGDKAPPMWALGLLQHLARYVFDTGNAFAKGHHMNLNGPIARETDTDIGAVLFVDDPELPARDTPHGRLAFVQIVGLTGDELAAVEAWNSRGFNEILRTGNPLLVTDVRRKSILADAGIARQVREETQREGASLGELYVSTARWQRAGRLSRLTLDALTVSRLAPLILGRLAHGRPLLVQGRGGKAENVVAFKPSEKPAVAVASSDALNIALPLSAAREVSETLRPERGVYRWPVLPDFEIEVVPTEIKDRDGKVVRVVG